MLHFAYGSNLDAGDLSRFGIERTPVARAYLPDRRLAFTHASTSRGGGVLDVVEAAGSAVEGMLFRLEADAEHALDEKENRGHRYRRAGVVVLDEDGRERPAFLYEVEPAVRERFVSPAPGYLDVVRRGYRAHGFDGAPLESAAEGRAHTGPVRSLFVYGTLMAGEERAVHLERHGMRAFAPARTRGTLIDLGAYPGLVLEGAGTAVAGELYAIADPAGLFATLDPVEGFRGFGVAGSHYRRTIVRASRGCASAPAWTYVYAGPQDGRQVIASGSWRRRAVE